MSIEVKRLAACGCDLGEGPVWAPDEQALLFTDIIGRRLLKWTEAAGVVSAEIGERVGCFAPISGEKSALLCAVEQGLERIDLDFSAPPRRSSVREGVVPPEALLNDGKCDPAGRFIFGSKSLNESDPIGALMLFDGVNLRVLKDNVIIENGPAFSPSGDKIYFADSPTQQIFVADYDVAQGFVGAFEVFAKLDDGYPDGMAVDAEGGLWNAHWDGARLTRYLPNGSVDLVVSTPISRPTSICFGGSDGKTMFITSAKRGRDDAEPLTEPMAGDLFTMQAPYAGARCFEFSGSLT